MPWSVVKRGNQHCVVKKGEGGETVKCHDSRDAALAQMKALYANEPKMKASEWADAMDWVIAEADGLDS